ncbi:PD-(D/E)XK motif protein [Rhodococcus sp. G-MC3]|uniref:PD-(D/E)XK motif protein n=1 Tax=Rhodococcus sp. G-MC3 TaxID=3046209 RepID=UPI0024BA996A|nr:PD-(D/E)XK motif protein [Rhodococcus sp. G-MC3]MDJ0395011.1 PD-(D/E)XK motif protein [Rhodococcus sp. G-MC3]
MTSEGVESILFDHWGQLEKGDPPGSGRLRTTGLPVDCEGGRLLAGLDPAKRRHLLIPLVAAQHVSVNSFGTNLRFSERIITTGTAVKRFADIACLNPELGDLFTQVCSDIILAVAASPSSALRATTTVLNRWRSLFLSSSSVLADYQIVGLFSELLLLRELLTRNTSASQFWTGPSGDRHDFSLDGDAIEVKSTTATDNRRVGVHGLDQLDPPGTGKLWLYWVRLERRSGAMCLSTLVSDVLALTDDYTGLLTKLRAVGYQLADQEWYVEESFEVVESGWYGVENDFPRLTRLQLAAAGVAINVSNVSYSLDLPDPGVSGMSDSAVRRMLYRLTGGGSR